MSDSLRNEHHDVISLGLSKLRKDCNLGQCQFLSLARFLDLLRHRLADPGVGLEHVRGDEVDYVLLTVTNR